MWSLFITIIPAQRRAANPGEIAISTQLIGSISSEKFANHIAQQIIKSLDSSGCQVRFAIFQRDELAS